MKASLRYRNKIDIRERLHEPRLRWMSKVFPLASVELHLAKSEEGKKKKNHKVRQAASSSPAVQADKDQCDK